MNEDYELTLFDRIEVIKTTNEKYDLEHNAYVSFSGGKDSTVLHYLIDLALPNNKIPRVYIDTGIEYNAIKEFVMSLKEKDDRFQIIKPTQPIKKILETYGYPFKNKEHSLRVNLYQHNCKNKTLDKYMGTGDFSCPQKLKYQFSKDFTIPISHKCCYKLKKEPAKKWREANHRPITITGMQQSEGGERANVKCILLDKNNNIVSFHPLAVVDEKFENEFIKQNNITLCKLYYPPFNFKRTGCKGCPYNLKLQQDLATMELYMPNERKQCEIIWKPIYDEYRRINYRLKRVEEMKLF